MQTVDEDKKKHVKIFFTHLKVLRTGYTAGILKPIREIQTLSIWWACVVGQGTSIYVNFTTLSLKTCKKRCNTCNLTRAMLDHKKQKS